MNRAPFAACAATLALALAGPLDAQQLQVGAEGFALEHRVLYQGTVAQRTGTWLGATAGVSVRRVRAELSFVSGSLGAADSANPATDVRTTALTVHWLAKPWLEVAAAGEARRFSSEFGVSVWRIFGFGARASQDLGRPEINGFGELMLYPIAGGSTAVRPSGAARGAVGIEVAPPGRVAFRLAYRLERYTFPASGAARREQFEGIVFGAGIRLGR